ncbi:MAG: fatty acid desaturase [Gammaproteobacteria bacterium]|nr:fatty acid desaturase [Gammaproteobacteria bacterium]
MAKTDSTIAQEMEVGRRHSPEIAWPTIRLAIIVYAALLVSTWAALSGALPYWVSALINAITLYGSYTVVHEAVHNNIVPRNERLRWLNRFFGFAVCILLWMFFYPHKRSHQVHHTRCNTEEDPDIYARGSFGVVTFWRIPLASLSAFNPLTLYRDCRQFRVPDNERRISMATFAAYTVFVSAIILSGYGYELLVLWFIPWFIGYSIMLVFFTWVPHHSHMETGRYRDTRCSIWPFANFLTQGQHMHLIHHMMSWIPYYQYEKVFHEIRPYLEQNNAKIDGFWPRSE